MRIGNCAGVVNDSVRPVSLEDLIGPPPEQYCVETRDVLRGRFGLFIIWYDPVQVSIGRRKVTVGARPVEHHNSSRAFHVVSLLATLPQEQANKQFTYSGRALRPNSTPKRLLPRVG